MNTFRMTLLSVLLGFACTAYSADPDPALLTAIGKATPSQTWEKFTDLDGLNGKPCEFVLERMGRPAMVVFLSGGTMQFYYSRIGADGVIGPEDGWIRVLLRGDAPHQVYESRRYALVDKVFWPFQEGQKGLFNAPSN